MTAEPSVKPVIWVGSSRKDLRHFPAPVQDHIGYALFVAQQGGKHVDAKPLTGFGGSGPSRLPEEVEDRPQDAEERD